MISKVKLPLILFAFTAQTALSQTTDLVITHARIEVGDGRVTTGNVFIHGDRIAGVGPDVPIPVGAQVLDATGLTLYPGFIDAYSTSGLKLPNAPTAEHAPDTRNTAPPTMWHGNRKGIRADIETSKSLDLKNRLNDNYKQGVTTALLSPGAGLIGGVSTVVDYIGTGSVVVPNEAVELSFRGTGGGFGGGYPSNLFGFIGLLRQTLADAQYYAAQTDPKKDATYENLKPLVTGQIPGLFAAESAREIVRASKIADEFSFKLIVLGGREAYRDIDLLKSKKFPVIVSADIGSAPSTTPEKTPDATPQAVLEERKATWEEHSTNSLKLNAAGIPFAFSSMGAIGGVDDFVKNVRKLIAKGLPRDVALKALTSQSASVLGIADKVGTIEVGKLANLVLYTGDFADDKSEVQMILVEGKLITVKQVGIK